MDGEVDSFNSPDMLVGCVIVANELISDMELWISLKSRLSAAIRYSLPTFISDDMWCRRCDDDVLATRDVVVLDFVDDVVLLLWTYIKRPPAYKGKPTMRNNEWRIELCDSRAQQLLLLLLLLLQLAEVGWSMENVCGYIISAGHEVPWNIRQTVRKPIW